MVPQPTLASQPAMPQPPVATAAAPSLLHLGHVEECHFDEVSVFSAFVWTTTYVLPRWGIGHQTHGITRLHFIFLASLGTGFGLSSGSMQR